MQEAHRKEALRDKPRIKAGGWGSVAGAGDAIASQEEHKKSKIGVWVHAPFH